MRGERIYFDDQGGSQMQVVKSDVAPCLLAGNLQKGHSLICLETRPKVIAFSQNTREEVRVLGDDGNCAGCLSAEGGMHQTTYICIQKKKRNVLHGTSNQNREKAAEKTLCCDSKLDASQLHKEVSCTILASSYKEPPLIFKRRI